MKMINPLTSRKVWVGLFMAFWSIVIVHLPALAEHIDVLVEMSTIVALAVVVTLNIQDVAKEKYKS
jgi:hypothetical protein